MYFYILFLKSDTIYYIQVNEQNFCSLIDDLSIEFKIDKLFEDKYGLYCCTYFYFDKKGKKKEIGYATCLKKDRFISRLPR